MPVKSLKLLCGNRVPWMAYGTGSALFQSDCTDACKLALRAGFNHLDTAQAYGNEDGVGRAITSSGIPRESLFVTTKLGELHSGQTVEDALRESLKKLQLEHVDLFLVHLPTFFLSREGGLKQVWREMVAVKERGLTSSIGVSNFNKAYLEEVIGLGFEKPVVNQVEYHLLVAARMAPLLSYMRDHRITLASYGTLSPIRATEPSLGPVLARLTSTLDTLARARGTSVTQNQILFKWLQAQRAIAVTTSSKESRLRENLATEDLPDLTSDEMGAIEDSVKGAHYRASTFARYMDD